MMITMQRQGKEFENITGSVEGKQFSIAYTPEKWQAMSDLQAEAEEAASMDELRAIVEKFKPLTEESYKDLVETKCPFIMVDPNRNKFYLKYGGQVSRLPMPRAFADRIIKSVEKDISPLPLVKAWTRYIREVPGRPKFTEAAANLFASYIDADYTDDAAVVEFTTKSGLAPEVAKEKATTKQVAITQEGLLVGYKVSREIDKKYIKDPTAPDGVKKVDRHDFNVDEDTGEKTQIRPDFVEDLVFEPWCMGQGGDAFLCGGVLGHKIKVGQVIELDDWSKVGHPGEKGLHVGGLRYIKGFQGQPNSVTHDIFIDPMDIHSIAGLGIGSDGAMTVKRYFPYRTFAGANKNIYHSSEYAKLTDAEWAGIFRKVVEETAMKKADLDKLLAENKALSVADKKTTDGTVPLGTSQVFGK